MCIDVFIDGISSSVFENPADIGWTQVELVGDLLQTDGSVQILVDIREDARNLHIMAGSIAGRQRGLGSTTVPHELEVPLGHIDHQSSERTTLHDIGTEIGDFL